jgi:hypothetical protein
MHVVPLNITTPQGLVRIGDARVELLPNGTVGDVELMILHPVLVAAIKGLKEWDGPITVVDYAIDLNKQEGGDSGR